jgi:hypothetical protein
MYKDSTRTSMSDAAFPQWFDSHFGAKDLRQNRSWAISHPVSESSWLELELSSSSFKLRGWRFPLGHPWPAKQLDLGSPWIMQKRKIIVLDIALHLHLDSTTAPASVTQHIHCLSVRSRALHGPRQSRLRGCAVTLHRAIAGSFTTRASSWSLPQSSNSLYFPCRTLAYHTTVSCS